MTIPRSPRSRRLLLAISLLLTTVGLAAGCGSATSSSSTPSSSSSTPSSSSSTASTSSSTLSSSSSSTSASPGVQPYTGPELNLPSSFPTPKRVAGKAFTIGFLNPIAANESLHALQVAIQKTAASLGGTAIVKDDQLKVDKQVTDFGQLLAQKVSAIVVYPLDPNSLGPSLKQAKAAGVPVVGIDVNANTADPLSPDYTAQILQGRDHEAFDQVQIMSHADPNGKIGIIGIGSPVPALKFLLAREEFYAKQAGLTVLGEQDNPTDDVAGGEQAGSGLLGKYSGITGVIGYNDPSALGGVAAARTNGTKIIAVGLNGGTDGIAGVEGGRLAGTVQTDSVGLGVQSVRAAYDALTKQGGKLPRTIVTPLHLVTKATVGSIIPWSKQLSKLG